MIGDLRGTLLGQRMANVYDLNEKTYLFKFTLSEATTAQVTGEKSEGSSKVMLLMESGIRFHTTQYARDKNDMPSPFAMKLRKYLRTKRLESVKQIGTDRVIDFQFGSGNSEVHIVLELYAAGNIILTDMNYDILALVRSYTLEDSDVVIQVGSRFTMPANNNATRDECNKKSILVQDVENFKRFAREKEEEYIAKELAAAEAPVTKTKGKGGTEKNVKRQKSKKMTVKQVLLEEMPEQKVISICSNACCLLRCRLN